MKPLRGAGVLALLSSAFSLAQNPSPNPNSSLTSNSVYQKECAKCHGKTAEGRHFGGPPLVTNKVANESTDDLRAIVTHGKGRMPHFDAKLSSGDIDTLVQQIEAANSK